MPLDEYRRKRDFSKTPEPDGSKTSRKRKADQGLFFSVQKHLASHLHYDLRLEWNGVLLSWAIPKGPSINPADKRLAMQTEDHPYDYGTFEGVIPEGYGAGIVMLWDRGTWAPESPDVDAALRKGDLKFRLEGYKLKGSWALVRTRGYGSGSKPSWLLIKHKDDWGGEVNITEFAPLSVKTPDADFVDILAADRPDVWTSNAPAKTGDTGALFKRIIAQALKMKEEREAAGGRRQAKSPSLRASGRREAEAPGAKAGGKRSGREAGGGRREAEGQRAKSAESRSAKTEGREARAKGSAKSRRSAKREGGGATKA